MQQLLDSLLDYSRSSLGRGISVTKREVDLAEECREELEVLRAALPDRKLELAIDGPAKGHFDASRIREVLSNLVHNAAKYSTADSTIQAQLSANDAGVSLSVENSGAPVSADELQAFFEPLRRGASEWAESGSDRANLGLGLFIVQEIARAHGGRVRAVSNEGKTTFTMTLPKTR